MILLMSSTHKFVLNLSLINAHFENFPLSITVSFNWVCIHGMMTWEIFSVHLICIKHFVAIYFHAHSSPCISYYVLLSRKLFVLLTNDLKYVFYAATSLQYSYLNEHKGTKGASKRWEGKRVKKNDNKESAWIS